MRLTVHQHTAKIVFGRSGDAREPCIRQCLLGGNARCEGRRGPAARHLVRLVRVETVLVSQSPESVSSSKSVVFFSILTIMIWRMQKRKQKWKQKTRFAFSVSSLSVHVHTKLHCNSALGTLVVLKAEQPRYMQRCLFVSSSSASSSVLPGYGPGVVSARGTFPNRVLSASATYIALPRAS